MRPLRPGTRRQTQRRPLGSPALPLRLFVVKTAKMWLLGAHPRGGGSVHHKAWRGPVRLKRIPRQTSQRMQPRGQRRLPPLETGLRTVLGHDWTVDRRIHPIKGRGIWERNLPGAAEQSLAFPRGRVFQAARDRQAALRPWLRLGHSPKPGERTPVPGSKAVTSLCHPAAASCSRPPREAEDAPQSGHAWMEARTHPPGSWGLELGGQRPPLGAGLGRPWRCAVLVTVRSQRKVTTGRDACCPLRRSDRSSRRFLCLCV